MIALYIVLGLLALICLLLFCFVTLTVSFDRNLSVYVGALGIRFCLFPKGKKKKGDKPKKGKTKKSKEENPIVNRFKSNTFTENVREVSDIVRSLVPILKNLLKRIRVREFTLDMRIANFDAAKTATDYGMVCSTVYPALSVLSTVVDLSLKKVDITAAFGETKSTVKIYVKIKLQVIILLIAAIKLFLNVKNLTEDVQNEREQHKINN